MKYGYGGCDCTPDYMLSRPGNGANKAEDYINRKLVVKKFMDVDLCGNHSLYMDEIRAEIESIPAADVRPVVRGRWIDIRGDVYEICCSICGDANYIKTNYCPNCGAKMDGESDV